MYGQWLYLQVCRAFRSSGVAEAAGAWPTQLKNGLQQRDYIATAGASQHPAAFVFDIDGVLIRGSRVLEPAQRALQRLYRDGGTADLTLYTHETCLHMTLQGFAGQYMGTAVMLPVQNVKEQASVIAPIATPETILFLACKKSDCPAGKLLKR